MKFWNHNLKATALCSMTGILFALLPLITRADDEINVEQIRRELRQAATAENADSAPIIGKEFALSEKDIETENARLEAQEAELLKKLSSPEAQALINDVAAGKAETLPINREIPPAGGDLENEATAAATARAETQVVQDLPKVENVPLVRAIRKVEEAEMSPKASLDTSVNEELTLSTLTKASAKTSSVSKSERSAEGTAAKSQKSDSKSATVTALNSQLASLRRTNTDLSDKLDKSELKFSELSKQLEAAKDRLMLAETEVERLASVIETRNRSAAMKFSGATANLGSAPQNGSAIAPVAQRTQVRGSDDTPVATVVAEKANLRTGPGADNSPLMSVTRGTRLVVETKHGEWYRVVSPTGARAWVSADVVAFGPNSQSSPTRTVRIKGYDSSLEAENFNIAKSAQ